MGKTAISGENTTFTPVEYIRIDEEYAGQRIDHFLAGRMRGVPHGHRQRLLRRGEVRVNSGRVAPGYCLHAGDRVRLPPYNRLVQTAPAAVPTAGLQRIADSVIFEDERLFVINKPAGVSVHAGGRHKWHVLAAARELRPELPFLELAHRLDRDTSGCLVLCKSPSLLRQLHHAFRGGQVHKRYLALVAGVAPARLEIDKPLTRSGQFNYVHEQGRAAHTRWRLLRRFQRASWGEMQPLTGRMHQLRVHAAEMKHPLVGDRKYGQVECNRYFVSLGLKRLFLHAAGLRFPPPLPVPPLYAPLPAELRDVLAMLWAERVAGQVANHQGLG